MKCHSYFFNLSELHTDFIGFHNDIQTYELPTLPLFRKFKQRICIVINMEPYNIIWS